MKLTRCKVCDAKWTAANKERRAAERVVRESNDPLHRAKRRAESRAYLAKVREKKAQLPKVIPTCKKCGQPRLGPRCKPCRAEYTRKRDVERYIRDRDKISTEAKARYRADPEPVKARSRLRYVTHADEIAIQSKVYRTKNAVELAAKGKARRADPARRAIAIARATAHARAHPEQTRKNKAACSKRHPEHARAKNHKRRVAAGSPLTSAQIRAVYKSSDYHCIDCGMREGDLFVNVNGSGRNGKPLNGTKMKLEVGHARPVGRPWYGTNDSSNLIPQCQPCNAAQRNNLHRSLVRSGVTGLAPQADKLPAGGR
jgi:hypothetical protein